ncbi:hypothetical protein PUN4_80070 [Paraburkholderia unamae]|nr:hypothetical protein PUN4_80070 [Paraburkholderia unamae]
MDGSGVGVARRGPPRGSRGREADLRVAVLAAVFDFLGGAREDRGDAALLLGRNVGAAQERALECAARLDQLAHPACAFGGVFAGHRAAHDFHLAAEVRELGEDQVGAFAIGFEVRAAFGRQFVALAVAFQRHAHIAELFQVREGRIDHAGARAVETVRARVERLDEFVAVARALGEQHEQHELQVFGRELAATAETVAVAETAEAAAKTFAEAIAEVAGAFAAAMAAHGVTHGAPGVHGGVRAVEEGARVARCMALTAGMTKMGMVAHGASLSRECLKICLKIYILRVFVKEIFGGMDAQRRVRERKNCVSGTENCVINAKFCVS